MFQRLIVRDLELSRPLRTMDGLEGYAALQGLVRLHGAPIGYVRVPVVGGRCTAAAIAEAIQEKHGHAILVHLLGDLLAWQPPAGGWTTDDLFEAAHPAYERPLPPVTVAVCTRDRTTDLARCLEGMTRLHGPGPDLLVVDNAPATDATERLVRESYPHVRYVREPRPGLNWARNRAVVEARGEIVAYTDDDAVVDPGWVRALAMVFAEHPAVMAVTGLVVPQELETDAQIIFERRGGFGRGFQRRWYRLDPTSADRWKYHGPGQYGTGANMAFRRSVFEQIGRFDPALDVGTVTQGGGDLEMFFRVLKEGHTLVYEPSAIVRHRHRREYAQLRRQVTNDGIGFFSYAVRSALAYPEERPAFMRLGWWWLRERIGGRLLVASTRPTRIPRDLTLAELKGGFVGLGRYQQARRALEGIAPAPGPAAPARALEERRARRTTGERPHAVAVRAVEVSRPVQALGDVAQCAGVRVYATWQGRPLGSVEIANRWQPVSATRLRDALAEGLGLRLLEPERELSAGLRWAEAMAVLRRRLAPTEAAAAASPGLPADVSVSVVVATRDRPDALRKCLRSLVAQASPRRVEVIVVDNHPCSGLTPPVAAEFPGVVLVGEPRRGLARARNAGIVKSRGETIVTADDDVTMPPDWLEKLVAPFTRPNVMAVAGNILPLELETGAQRLFESYGGLGRGFERREVDGDWFESFRRRAVPTWELGATANAAFRARIFEDPEIGLLDEALGAGTPTGCSEDTYLFYRLLKAGHTLVYQPAAYVWHEHRRELPALRRQIYDYSRGHVAYHLTTVLRDHDLRGLVRLGAELPLAHLTRIAARLRGESDYPLSLVLLEVAGNLAGPWALWRSRRRAGRQPTRRARPTASEPLESSTQVRG